MDYHGAGEAVLAGRINRLEAARMVASDLHIQQAGAYLALEKRVTENEATIHKIVKSLAYLASLHDGTLEWDLAEQIRELEDSQPPEPPSEKPST